MTGEELKAIIAERIERDPRLRKIRARISKGRVTKADSFTYSRICSEIMSEELSRAVLDLDDREGICAALLRGNYEEIMQTADAIQRSIDVKQGIHMQPRRPAFPAERVQQIAHSLVQPDVPDETIRRRAGSTATVSMSFHDDFVQENARFRAKAGLKCYITRETDGKCCAWCAKLAGRYEYGEEPEEVYHRHDNCGCTVTYETGRQRQDVWSKRTWEAPAAGAGAKEPARLTPEQAAAKEAEHLPKRLTPGAESGTMNLRKLSAQSVDDRIQWLPKGVELSAEQRRLLTEYAAAHGIVLKGLAHTDVDIELMKETIDTAAAMLKRFPELNRPDLPVTIKVVNGMDSRDFAMTTKRKRNIIQLNANAFRDRKKLSEEYDKLVKARWFPEGTTYRSIIIHEIGHMYESMKKPDVLEIIRRIMLNAGEIDISPTAIEGYLMANLSRYSTAGISVSDEVVSEVFNVVFGGSIQNEFAKEFITILLGGGWSI